MLCQSCYLRDRPTHCSSILLVWSSTLHKDMRCQHWRGKSAATPVALPSRGRCSRHSHGFQLFTDLAHELQVAGVNFGACADTFVLFWISCRSRQGPSATIRARHSCPRHLNTTFSTCCDAHLGQGRRRQQSQHPMDATSITLFLEQCLLEYTSEPAECGSVMQC